MKNIVIALFLTISAFKTGHGKSSCGMEKFQCKNGDCIESILLCDGEANCKDKSDETVAECSQADIKCPHTAFRCAYGACVDGDATCNGVKDCVDNSDETLPKCNTSISSSSECRDNEFKCNNGQCIAKNNLCDGNANCSDGSDETFIQCGGILCEQLFFRCRYGACIENDLKCNGVINCVDGSDENPTLCGTVSSTTERLEPPITPLITSTLPPYVPSVTCKTPSQPQNGDWKLHKSQCQSGEHCHVGQDFQFQIGTHLVYSCNRGFRIKGSTDVFCGISGVWYKIPECEEVRCTNLNSASIVADCKYPGPDFISCDSPKPGTIATLKCRDSYREDRTLPSPTTVRCSDNGEWTPQPLRCVPVCGIIPKSTTPLIVNGTTANITEFPWHATLYRAVTPTAPKEFICGGTIIHEKLVITAAHCVYDENNRRKHDASKFFIATGIMYRDYDSPYHNNITLVRTGVKKVHVSCDYNGIFGAYKADIAILEVANPFVFSTLLQPICLDYSSNIILEPDMIGRVAGFGRTALGPSSYILQTIKVPYISNRKCKEESNIFETENYITYDKFCAGYTNGSSVCDGDSGGGLIFQWSNLWYLKGIVSVSLGTKVVGGTRQCDSSTYSLYTAVSVHMQWMEDFILGVDNIQRFHTSCDKNLK
nr:modular serine protease-like isoform X1 [Megalopta genalis]XP_033343119.1 modular serine protease-like isoform X2 [Megalopta genalis]